MNIYTFVFLLLISVTSFAGDFWMEGEWSDSPRSQFGINVNRTAPFTYRFIHRHFNNNNSLYMIYQKNPSLPSLGRDEFELVSIDPKFGEVHYYQCVRYGRQAKELSFCTDDPRMSIAYRITFIKISDSNKEGIFYEISTLSGSLVQIRYYKYP